MDITAIIELAVYEKFKKEFDTHKTLTNQGVSTGDLIDLLADIETRFDIKLPELDDTTSISELQKIIKDKLKE